MSTKVNAVYVVSTYRNKDKGTILAVYESFKEAYDFCSNIAKNNCDSFNAIDSKRSAHYTYDHLLGEHWWRVYFCKSISDMSPATKTIELKEMLLKHSKEES